MGGKGCCDWSLEMGMGPKGDDAFETTTIKKTTIIDTVSRMLLFPTTVLPFTLLAPLLLLLLDTCTVWTQAVAPIALHFTVPATSNSENLIRLRSYDSDGDTTQSSIVSMNGCGTTNCGTLNQLSQPYSAYGYLPKAGNVISGQPTPIDVTGSANRIVYTPPKNKRSPEDRWGWFEWQSYDGSSYSTKPGIVALLAPGNVLVQSSFMFNTEQWSVVSNGAGGVGTSHSASSRGLLNHYIHSKDDEININPSTGKRCVDVFCFFVHVRSVCCCCCCSVVFLMHLTSSFFCLFVTGADTRLWYFVAPSKFLASATSNPTNMLAFGGSLTFTMSSQAGDFSTNNLNANVPFVILECATCDSGMGIRLVRMFGANAADISFDGKEKVFTVPMTTSATNKMNGVVWLKDSKSTLIKYTETNDCELIEVLNGLSSLKILGDFTKWHESVSLDDVKLVAGHPVTIPLACYPVG